jgi:hypothetical protein
VIAEAKVQQRVEAKQARLVEKERKKADRVAEHEVQNAAKKAEALARKAQRQIAHETRNAALKAEKASRKVRKREQLVLKGVQ